MNRQTAGKRITGDIATRRNRRGRPSESEGEAKKHAVVCAARAEFIANGYRSATMEGIAVRAEVSKRTLYIWYEDKAALFRACIVEGASEITLPVFNHEEELEIGLFKFTLAVMLAVTADEAMKMAALMTREGYDFPELYESIERSRSVIINPIVAALLNHGVAPRHSLRIARFFLSTVFSNLNDRITFGLPPMTPKEIEEDVQYSVSILMRGISDFAESADTDLCDTKLANGRSR